MTTAENSISEPPNLKIFWRRIPQTPPTRLVPLALALMSPCYKKASYGPEQNALREFHQGQNVFVNLSIGFPVSSNCCKCIATYSAI